MILSKTTLKKLFKFLYLIYYCLLSVFDILLIFISVNKFKKRNILLIKLDRFGDFILWNTNFNNILDYHKNDTIFLICNEELEKYLRPLYKKVIFISINKYRFLFNLKYRYEKLIYLRKIFFYKVINFHRERNIYFSDSIVKNLNAKNKIASTTNEKNLLNYISNKHYNNLIKTKLGTHESHYLDEFMSKIFKKNFTKKNFIKFKKNKIYSRYRNFILVSCGGTDKRRLVSLDKMLTSLEFKKKQKMKIIIVGKIDEINISKQNFQSYKNRITSLAGKTTFDDFIYLHSLANTIISNDSVSGHLAHYFKKKSYTFIGGGHFNRFFPYPVKSNNRHKYIYEKMKCYNCNWNCIYDNLKLTKYPCIEKIEKNNNLIKV
jgi:ADP-heptose:LPS heptosyltransferase